MASRNAGRRPALGTHPFSAADAYLDAPPEPTTLADRAPSSRRSPPPSGSEAQGKVLPMVRRPKKVRGTFQMSEDLLQTARNAVVALSGPPHRLTLASLVEEAMSREIRRLEKEHNGGKPFPPMDQPLRQGRPIGS